MELSIEKREELERQWNCETNHKNQEVMGQYVVCHDCKSVLGRKTEVWSRPCGYLRPTDHYNLGKQAEFNHRKSYKIRNTDGNSIRKTE